MDHCRFEKMHAKVQIESCREAWVPARETPVTPSEGVLAAS
jgi:hypothetical protein